MPDYRAVTILLLAAFLLVVVVDYWRKSRLLAKAKPATPQEAPDEAPPPGA